MKLDSEHEFHHRKSEMKEMMTQSNSQPTRRLVRACNSSRVLFNVLACLLLLALLPVSAGAAGAGPTINFSYAQNTLGTYANPSGVVVDKSGVVTVADELGLHGEYNTLGAVTGGGVYGLAVDSTGNIFTILGSSLVEFTPHCLIDSCAHTLGSLSYGGYNLALDANDNVYLSGGLNTVYEVPAPAYNAMPVLGSISGSHQFNGMVVDGSGNVFVADGTAGVVLEYPPSGGLNPGVAVSGLVEPYGVALGPDGSNLFVTDCSTGWVYETTGGGKNTVGGNFSCPKGVAVDSNGNVYVLATSTNGDYFTSGTLYEVIKNPHDFGTASNSYMFYFDIVTAGTLGGVAALTEGASGLDFSIGQGGSCIAGHTYSAGQQCTVIVNFSTANSQFPGLRQGAVVLTDTSGAAISTVYVHGIVQTAQVSFLPETQSTVGSGFNMPTGVAVDGYGNIFVADSGNNAVKEILVGGGVKTLASGFSNPQGVAVDGAGNIIVADTGNNAVKMILAPGYTSVFTVGSGTGFSSPMGVAVDENGNVYVADSGNNAVKMILSSDYTTVKTLGSGFISPEGVAVDESGNIFVADTSNSVVKEILAAGGYTKVNTLGGTVFGLPKGVAVDNVGNVFVADTYNNAVKEIPAAGGYTTVNTLASGFPATAGSSPNGVAVDQWGNVYLANAGLAGNVFKLDYADGPTLSFATPTAVGKLDITDGEQTVTLQNIGNQPLSISEILAWSSLGAFSNSSAMNPQSQSSFWIDGSPSTACASSVAGGASCTISVNFEPTATASSYYGQVSGQVWIEDQILTAGYQAINLNGTASLNQPQSIVFPTPAAQTYGTPLTLSAWTSSGRQVNFTVISGPATLSGWTLTFTGTGSVTVQATQVGDWYYGAATPQSVTFMVNKATPTVTFTGAPARAGYNSKFDVIPTTNASSAPVITASGSCTVLGAVVTMTSGTGTCSLAANWAADSNYLAASANQSTIATQIAPTVAFKGAPASTGFQSTFTVSATTNASTAAVITASGSCTVASTTVTTTASTGTCSLSATWAADANYLAASAPQSTIVTKAGVPIYLSVSTLAVGDEGVGVTSAPKTVYLYNFSGSTVSPAVPASVGVFATSAGSCASPVPTNKFCSFTVTFTPTATGAAPSTLTVHVGATTLPLALTGTGVQPLYLSVSALAFGDEGLHVTSAPKTVYLYNFSGSTVSPSVPASVGVFATSAGSCATPVPTNTFCSFTVTFTPTATGAVAPATLNVQAGGITLPLALTGTGVQPLYLSVSALTLGDAGLHVTSVPKTVNLYNFSGSTVSPSVPASVGVFATSAGSCASPVPTNTFCSFTVTFTPTATGAAPSTLNVQVGATTLPLALTGTGVQPLYLSVSTLAVGDAAVGLPSAPKTVYLYNFSGSTVSPAVPPSVGAFATSAGSCASPVPTNASCSFTVTFTPTATGAVAPATLNVVVGATTLPLALTGTGVQPLYLSVSTLAFGGEGLHVTSAPKTVYLYNFSGSTVSPAVPAAVGVFATSAGSCANPVPTNASCSFTVTFTPTAMGAAPSTLDVHVGATTLPLALTGTGV
jgi:sugar lactone lactonase YvrE